MQLRLQNMPEPRDHGGNNRLRSCVARKSIRVGEEVTLKRWRGGIEVMNQRRILGATEDIIGVNGHALRKYPRDIEAVGPLRNYHGIEEHIAHNQLAVDID